MPFDSRAWLIGREELPPDAARAWLYLLCELWENGPLPNTAPELSRLARVSRTIFKRRVWPYIAQYLEETSTKAGKKLIEPWTYQLRIKEIGRLAKREEMSRNARARYAENNGTKKEPRDIRGS